MVVTGIWAKLGPGCLAVAAMHHAGALRLAGASRDRRDILVLIQETVRRRPPCLRQIAASEHGRNCPFSVALGSIAGVVWSRMPVAIRRRIALRDRGRLRPLALAGTAANKDSILSACRTVGRFSTSGARHY